MICQSGRACPRGGWAARTRCTRRSVFVKVPSFSANGVAGRKTSAKAAELIDEEILRDQELQLLHVVARHIQVGFGHHGVLPHDVQGADTALVCMAQDLRGGQARACAESPPGSICQACSHAAAFCSSSTRM